jgi:hypothetical protein
MAEYIERDAAIVLSNLYQMHYIRAFKLRMASDDFDTRKCGSVYWKVS